MSATRKMINYLFFPIICVNINIGLVVIKQYILFSIILIAFILNCQEAEKPDIPEIPELQQIFKINTPIISKLVKANNSLFFYTIDAQKNWTLYNYTGSGVPVIRAEISDSFLNTNDLFVLNNKLYCFNGSDLYTYDETNGFCFIAYLGSESPEGAELRAGFEKDPYFKGMGFMGIHRFTFITGNNTLYILVEKGWYFYEGGAGEIYTFSLWVYNEEIGVVRLCTVPQYWTISPEPSLLAYTDKIYGFHFGYSQNEIWIYDKFQNKTEKGTGEYKFSENNTVFDDFFYFSVSTENTGYELVGFDRLNPPYLVKDINAEVSSSNPANFTVCCDKLYFSADDGINGRKIWVFDAINEPVIVDSFYDSMDNYSTPENLSMNKTDLYFTAGDALWIYDGLNAPYSLMKNPDILSFTSFTSYNNHLYFFSKNADNDVSMWQCD